jgi:molecular chaperone DnaK (HSP70)
MMLFNMGAVATQVSIAEYTSIKRKEMGKRVMAGVFTMKSKAWDENLGGRDFDNVLIDYFLTKFCEKEGIPVVSNEVFSCVTAYFIIYILLLQDTVRRDLKAMAKLEKNAMKVKEILTVNKDTQVMIEGLYNGVDYRDKITRDQFHKLSSHLFDKLLAPVSAALHRANLTTVRASFMLLI